jgi:hypothetical protein
MNASEGFVFHHRSIISPILAENNEEFPFPGFSNSEEHEEGQKENDSVLSANDLSYYSSLSSSEEGEERMEEDDSVLSDNDLSAVEISSDEVWEERQEDDEAILSDDDVSNTSAVEISISSGAPLYDTSPMLSDDSDYFDEDYEWGQIEEEQQDDLIHYV